MSETIYTPKWINKSFLETALRSGYENHSITITSYEVTRATVDGENYGSNMYRVTIFFTRGSQSHKTSLVIKSELEEEEISKVMSEAKTFQRESEALEIIMPAIHQLLEQTSSAEFQPFAAKCFYIHTNFPFALVLEDLKEKGFRTAERTRGLDLQHCLLVMRKLARCHAVSAILHQKNPELFQKYESLFDEKRRKALTQFFEVGAKNLAAEVDKWPKYKNIYSGKLHAFSDGIVDFLIKDAAVDGNDFNVFLHGDLWVNNIMFRYSEDTGDVVDLRFVDFQLSYFSNAAQDLQYFLNTSTELDLLDKHDILVREYHKTLGKTFALLGYEQLHPTLEQLHKQMEKKGRYTVAMALTVLPIMLSDRNKVPDMEKLVKDGESVYFSDQYKQVLRKLLPIFERKGWL
ncbi:uncharacterized protein [Periplaneta americana]|uniref:uncharacterized protein n=1 Tax=Periplaneta americana TaxID=6978 RepID=UPI0037E89254